MHSCFVCFCSAFGTFAYSHERIAQKWAAPASLPIAWQISVDFEERMRRSMQTGSAFCCSSFGSSFLYDLSCRRKSLATLRSASRFGLLCPLSLKTAAISNRFCRGPVGETLPSMRAVRDAVQSEIPPTHLLVGVSDGGRSENTEGLGHHVGLGPPAVILRRRGSVGESRVV